MVDGDGLRFPWSLNLQGPGKPGYIHPGGYYQHCCILYGMYCLSGPGFMWLWYENMNNNYFTAKSFAWRLCYISPLKSFQKQNTLAFVFRRFVSVWHASKVVDGIFFCLQPNFFSFGDLTGHTFVLQCDSPFLRGRMLQQFVYHPAIPWLEHSSCQGIYPFSGLGHSDET